MNFKHLQCYNGILNTSDVKGGNFTFVTDQFSHQVSQEIGRYMLENKNILPTRKLSPSSNATTWDTWKWIRKKHQK